MKKFNVIEPRKGKDGFYDDTLPFMTIMKDVDAETANRYMMYHLEYRLYAQDTETNELYHRSSTGLVKM